MTRTQAFNRWIHGPGGRSLQPDLYEAFSAGWEVQQAEIDRLRDELTRVIDLWHAAESQRQRRSIEQSVEAQ